MFTPDRILIGLCLALLTLSFFMIRELFLQPDGLLHFYQMDVGQGDSAFIVSPSGKQIVIDGGPDVSALAAIGERLPFFDKSLDLVVLTHPEADHITALPDILDRYEVGAVLLSGVAGTLPAYTQMLAKIREHNIPIIFADPGRDIDLGDGTVLDVVWPPPSVFGQEFEHFNDTSIVVRVLHGSSAALFTGDIEEPAETQILKTGADLSADILKSPHHGSKTSSSTGFLLAVNPDLALISAGRNNRYGHPHPSVTERYKQFGIEYRSTAEEGAIEVVVE